MKFRHPDILPDDSDPAKPLTRRMNVSPDNPNVIIQGPFYRVSDDMSRVPIRDCFYHGYTTSKDFKEAIQALVNRWKGREGECIEKRCFHGKYGEPFDERNCQLLLRFHDTPGGSPDEAWLPLYILEAIPVPDYARWHTSTHEEQLLDEINSTLWDE